jgi:hypothetical protein
VSHHFLRTCAAWRAELEATERSAGRAVERARRDASAVGALLDGDAALRILPSEVAIAGGTLPLLERQARSGPLREVVAAVRGAVLRNDRIAMVAWLVASKARLAAGRPDAAPGGDGRTDPGRVPIPDADDERAALQGLLGQIRERLADHAAAPLAGKRAVLLNAAGDLSGRIHRRRSRAALDEQVRRGELIRWPDGG